MSQIQESIDVAVPIQTAYNQWTQFEEFPRFMEGVDEVQQLEDDTLKWRASIAGVKREWTARITEQVPDDRVAWTSDDGAANAGVVTFHRLADDKTRVMLQLDFDPQTFAEKAGDALGVVRRRAAGDLERFKTFIEERGAESGAWRGEIDHGAGSGSAAPKQQP